MKDEIQHFSKEDIFYSFYGALFIGMVFSFNKILIDVAKAVTAKHIFAIIILTIILTTIQIYYIGYTRVKEREKRPFSEFWAKRFFTVYLISLLTPAILIYIYNINSILGSTGDVIKAIFVISMPCTLGATLSDLVRKIKF